MLRIVQSFVPILRVLLDAAMLQSEPKSRTSEKPYWINFFVSKYHLIEVFSHQKKNHRRIGRITCLLSHFKNDKLINGIKNSECIKTDTTEYFCSKI